MGKTAEIVKHLLGKADWDAPNKVPESLLQLRDRIIFLSIASFVYLFPFPTIEIFTLVAFSNSIMVVMAVQNTKLSVKIGQRTSDILFFARCIFLVVVLQSFVVSVASNVFEFQWKSVYEKDPYIEYSWFFFVLIVDLLVGIQMSQTFSKMALKMDIEGEPEQGMFAEIREVASTLLKPSQQRIFAVGNTAPLEMIVMTQKNAGNKCPDTP